MPKRALTCILDHFTDSGITPCQNRNSPSQSNVWDTLGAQFKSCHPDQKYPERPSPSGQGFRLATGEG